MHYIKGSADGHEYMYVTHGILYVIAPVAASGPKLAESKHSF